MPKLIWRVRLSCCISRLKRASRGTRRLGKQWDLVDLISSERDGGDPSLRTSLSTGIIDVTLAALMDENNVSSEEGDDKDNTDGTHGVSLGPRMSDSQAFSLPTLTSAVRGESYLPSAQASEMPSVRGSEVMSCQARV